MSCETRKKRGKSTYIRVLSKLGLYKADLSSYLGHSASCVNVCIVSAHLHNLFEILLIGDELSELVSYVLQAVGASLTYSELKVTVALSVELALDLLIGLVGGCS